MISLFHKKYASPIGDIYALSSSKGLKEVFVNPQNVPKLPEGDPFGAIAQLTEYFNGQRKQFDVPLDIEVTPFTNTVLKKIYGIPFGKNNDLQRAGSVHRQTERFTRGRQCIGPQSCIDNTALPQNIGQKTRSEALPQGLRSKANFWNMKVHCFKNFLLYLIPFFFTHITIYYVTIIVLPKKEKDYEIYIMECKRASRLYEKKDLANILRAWMPTLSVYRKRNCRKGRWISPPKDTINPGTMPKRKATPAPPYFQKMFPLSENSGHRYPRARHGRARHNAGIR